MELSRPNIKKFLYFWKRNSAFFDFNSKTLKHLYFPKRKPFLYFRKRKPALFKSGPNAPEKKGYLEKQKLCSKEIPCFL